MQAARKPLTHTDAHQRTSNAAAKLTTLARNNATGQSVPPWPSEKALPIANPTSAPSIISFFILRARV